MRRARVLVWSLWRASLLRMWRGTRNFASILSCTGFPCPGRELRYKKAHPGTLYLWISLDFRNSIPILRTRTGRWHARLFIFSVRLHVHAICFWLRSLASSAPGILLLRWGLYGYRGLFACCSMRFLKILKKMHSAVVINERLMFHLFSKCQLPCLRILFLQFSGLHWTGQWFVT